jgi:tRNA (cmo5U34)-methyltransferase
MSGEKDSLFASSRATTTGFRFDENVVRVFPDMISRSVPGYELVIPMIGMLARRYAQADSKVYDLGCSLGASSLAMAMAIKQTGVEIVAVDNSEAMVDQCRELVTQMDAPVPVQLRLENILHTPIHNASVVVLNFTLQFLDRGQRQGLIERIATGLREGGVLIVSEKICFEDSGEQEEQTAWHHDFKRTQGYSEMEIAQKRNALEDVLQPDTEFRQIERLEQSGLINVRRWFQCFSFASYIAFK